MLVALAILAIFSLFAWRATAALADGETQLAGEAARWQALDATFARIDADVRAAVPRAIRTIDGAEPAWVGGVDAQGQGTLTFTRGGLDPSDPLAGGMRLGYRLRGGAVEFLAWPVLDRGAGVEPRAYALVDRVAALVVHPSRRGRPYDRSLARRGRRRAASRPRGRVHAGRRLARRALDRAAVSAGESARATRRPR